MSAPVDKSSRVTPVDWRKGFDHVEDSRRREEFKSYPCGIPVEQRDEVTGAERVV